MSEHEKTQSLMSIIPWKIYESLIKRERVMLVVSLAISLLVISVYTIQADTNIFESVSNYLTILFFFWISVVDAKNYRIPNQVLIAWLFCRLLLILISSFFDDPYILITSVGGAALITVLFFISYYLSRRSMGGGDVKLSFVMGLSLTFSLIFTAVFFGLIFCALYGLVGIVRKKLTIKDALPLSPFLFMGTIATYITEMI